MVYNPMALLHACYSASFCRSLAHSSIGRIDLQSIWTLLPIFFMTGRSSDILSTSVGSSTQTTAITWKTYHKECLMKFWWFSMCLCTSFVQKQVKCALGGLNVYEDLSSQNWSKTITKLNDWMGCSRCDNIGHYHTATSENNRLVNCLIKYSLCTISV